MKSFKQYLNEDASDASDASVLAAQPAGNNSDNPTIYMGFCESWLNIIAHRNGLISDLLSSLEACRQQEWTGCLDNDGIIDCAEQCLNDMCPDGVGGKGFSLSEPDCFDPVVWIECIEACGHLHDIDCEKVKKRCDEIQENIDAHRRTIRHYEHQIAKRCGKEYMKSTRKPGPSGKPNTGVTPIEPTIGPNIK